MNVKINGDMRDVPQGLTLEGLLSMLEITRQGIAVEVNREVVPRGSFPKTKLNEGDAVEIIRMAGGG